MARKKTARKTARRKSTPAKGDIYARLRAQAEKERMRSRGNYWDIPKGESIVRPVPFFHNGSPEVFVLDLRHWGLDPSNRGFNVVCGGEDCPICNLKDEVSEKSFSRITRRKKYLFNAVVRKCPDNDGLDAHVIVRAPVSVAIGRDDDPGIRDYLIGNEEQDLKAIPNALDEKKGRDFKIRRKGDGLSTRYRVAPMPKPSPLGLKVKPYDLAERQESSKKTEEELQEIAEAYLKSRGG